MRSFLYIVGTRPNFMKMAPILTAMREGAPEDRHVLVHTGQHYDASMSSIFFDELGMPKPDHYLGVGSGRPGAQTARVIEAVEEMILDEGATTVLVPGDVNSTLGAAIAAAKCAVPLVHVESGLRSFDRTMPEEHNRILTDQLADVLFTHSREAHEHLAREGVDPAKVHFVGNTMIDTLVRLRPLAATVEMPVEPPYLLVTLHRPALVDDPMLLEEVLRALDALGQQLPVVFPAHPRTLAALGGTADYYPNVQLLPPTGYVEFLALQEQATAVLTDSGGIQEETSFLGVPCFTLRDGTERPVTVTQGTNVVLGLAPERIAEIPALLADRPHRAAEIEGWDGRAARRIAELLDELPLMSAAGQRSRTRS